MKRIIIFLLLFAALKVAGQTTGYLRFDTVKIMKQNGTCEMYIINKTKDTLGVLTNIGGGLTRFIKPKMLNDSMLIVGLDTLTIHGAGGGSANARYSITKSSDSLQLLNDETSVKRNHSYTTMDDGTRRWNPSYWSFVDKYYAAVATSDNAAVGGSSTVRLSNGTWLSAFVSSGSNPEDGNSSTIHAFNSNDNLRTFYNRRQIVTLDTLEAHFGPSLYVKGTNISTGDTVILVWATQINSVDYNYVGDIRMRVSNDGGETWGSVSILRSASTDYYNNFPNRIFRTNSGKLIYPFERLRPGSQGPGITSSGWDGRFLYSTNNGASWTYSTALPSAPDSGMIESGFYQRKGETRLYWYSRSLRRTAVYTAYSDDDGVTWTTPDYMNYSASFSNTTIKYINSLDAFVGFSNRANGSTQADKRKYLNGFISSDGQNFQQFMTIDSVVDTAPGVIGVSDIIDFDTSIVVMYNELPNTGNAWANFKVARIPRTAVNSSFGNIGIGIGIPSGGDADRPSSDIPLIRYNTNSNLYEGSLRNLPAWGYFLQTGNLVNTTYPFWQVNLRSYNQSGRLNLINQDNTYAYNSIEGTKLFNSSGNLGEGTTGFAIGCNTMSSIRWISSANATGGYSTFDHTFWSTNAAGTNAERMRLTAEGRLGIGTDVPATKLHVNGTTRFDLGSDANYDVFYRNSSGQFTRLAAGTDGYVLTTHSTTSAPTWEAASGSDGNGIYGGNGTLPSDVTVSTGGNTLTVSGSNDNETSFSVTNTGTTSASAIAGTASGTTSTGVTGTSSSYIGVFGSSTSNTGVQGQSSSGVGVIGVSSTGAGLRGQINPSSSNAIENTITLSRTSSAGAGANGIGAAIQYELETATNGNSQTAGSLAFQWTDATTATRTSQFEIYGVNSATTARKAAIAGNGQWTWDAYGSGTHTGTPTGSLQVTSGGSVIEGPMVAAGTFTPTLTAVTNTSSPLLDGARYTRIGNIVTFSLRFSVTTSSGSSASSIRVTLPVASSFSNINQAAGTCSGSLGRVESDATNDELIVAWTSGAGGTETIVVTGQYTIL